MIDEDNFSKKLRFRTQMSRDREQTRNSTKI